MSKRSSSDKLLLAIIAVILLIVVLAFVVVMRRPQPEYQAENTPEAVVHDYLMALQSAEYDRAYSYLSPALGYPADIDEFYDSLKENPWEFTSSDNFSLVVESSRPVSEGSVAVTVRQIFSTNSLFAGDSYSELLTYRLEEGADGWKIVSGDRYFSSCWGEENLCDDPPRSIP